MAFSIPKSLRSFVHMRSSKSSSNVPSVSARSAYPRDGSYPTNQRRPSAKHCGTGRPFNGMI